MSEISISISKKGLVTLGAIIIIAVLIHSFFKYLGTIKQSANSLKIETARLEMELALESKKLEIESEKVSVQKENVRLNATTNASTSKSLDKMTNCIKTIMEETRNNKFSTINAKDAKEICRDLNK